MSKEAELNQFGEVGGMQPNELNQTDHCDDGGMKINEGGVTNEIKQSFSCVHGDVIMANETYQIGPFDEGVVFNVNEINQSRPHIDGEMIIANQINQSEPDVEKIIGNSEKIKVFFE